MFLKNYTSSVAVSITIGRIESTLIRCGVKGITKEYDGKGGVIAIMFHLPGDRNDLAIRLPADEQKAQDAFWKDYCDSHPDEWKRKKTRGTFKDQAARTAWKLIQDWVEVQMSLIQMQQAEYIQVFMPYIWDGKQTLFDRVKTNGYRALLPEKTES